jgi:hypothetical protein
MYVWMSQEPGCILTSRSLCSQWPLPIKNIANQIYSDLAVHHLLVWLWLICILP